jgi:signal transduction histidine kinase
LHALSRRVVEVQEQERRHLARELHDEIGQVLSAISINLQALKGACDAAAGSRIEDSIHIVDQAAEQVQNLSLDLRPSMLDDLGLVATLRWLVDRQAQRADLISHFIAESSGAAVPPNVTIACFRVVQEALTNVVRHARARNVWVEFRQAEDEVYLSVRDDGEGFDPGITRHRATGSASLGLLGIRERVELLGGRSEIKSQPGHGTSIRVWFPTISQPTDQNSAQGGDS